MPKDKIDWISIKDNTRPEYIYPGEAPRSNKMTAQRLYTSTSAPTVNNDGYDSAGLGQAFEVGDLWQNTTTSTLYQCIDNTQAAAVWGVFDAFCSKTVTICTMSGAYSTIQAALDANTSGGELFIVSPGTYTNDTINFTADRQTVATIGKGNNVIVSNSSQVVDAGDYAGCKIKNIRINFTPTTAIDGIVVNDGTFSMDSCRLDLTTSTDISGVTQPHLMAVTGTGTLTTKFGEYTYQHTGDTTNGIKAMFSIGTGGTLEFLRACISSITNSGSAAATTIAIDAGTGVIDIREACDITVTDTEAAIVAGLGYIGGSGSSFFDYSAIEINGGGSNACYGVYNAGSGTVRSNHNAILVQGGLTNYSFFTGVGATTISICDDVRAADRSTGNGTFTYSSSLDDGGLSVSTYMELPYLSGAPATLRNGMIWMEADGLHIYYNNTEKLVAVT